MSWKSLGTAAWAAETCGLRSGSGVKAGALLLLLPMTFFLACVSGLDSNFSWNDDENWGDAFRVVLMVDDGKR
jgi:hypothetical protein